MRLFCVLSLFLVFNGQANSLTQTWVEKDLAGHVDEWLNTLSKDFPKEQVKLYSDEKSLQAARQANENLDIGDAFKHAQYELDTRRHKIGQICYQKAVNHLQLLKKSSLSQFVNCNRLQYNLRDFGRMVNETAAVSVKLNHFVKDLFDLLNCRTGNEVNDQWCLMVYFWKTWINMRLMTPLFQHYPKEIVKLAKNFEKAFNNCSHPGSYDVREEVIKILKQSDLCAERH